MGPSVVFAVRLGHLLLLYLEGGQVHWQGRVQFVDLGAMKLK